MTELRVANCDSCPFLDRDDDPGLIVVSDFHRLTLATDQLYLGRAYLTLGRHASRISDLTKDEVFDMYDLISRYELACETVYGAIMVTSATLMNNAYQERKPVPHVHSHLRPRYSRAVNVNGSIFEDPNFGHHHLRNRTHNVSAALLAEIALPLKEAMASL